MDGSTTEPLRPAAIFILHFSLVIAMKSLQVIFLASLAVKDSFVSKLWPM